MRWEVGATAVAAVLFTSVAAEATAAACTAAAQPECLDGSGMAEAESEQMRAELVQTGARVLGSPGGGPAAGQLASGQRRPDDGRPTAHLASPPRARTVPTEGAAAAATTEQPYLRPGDDEEQLDTERYAGLAHFLRTRRSAELDALRRGRLIVPIAYFHVAKTGTSFQNSLFHTPAICPGFSPANFFDSGSGWDESWGDRDEVCRGGFSDSYSEHSSGMHTGIGGLTGTAYKLNRGHFVGMFRQPEQRLISQYWYTGISQQPLVGRNGQDIWPYSSGVEKAEVPSLREYAEWNAGAVVRQLTADSSFSYKVLPLPTTDDVSAAIKVLQDGFSFVGITDEWALSICLFHAMFGGPCLSSDLLNTRPGTVSNTSGYDTSGLYGWVDVWDGPVYSEAVLLFESARNLYGVNSRWCVSSCRG